jgi:hypothetical protein
VKKDFFSVLHRPPHSATLLLVTWVLVSLAATNAQQQLPSTQEAATGEAARQRYNIQLKIDFDALSYAGSERYAGSTAVTTRLQFSIFISIPIFVPLRPTV